MVVLNAKRARASAAMIVVLAISALSGCIGTSPEQAEADALGPDPGPFESGPNHRAGFPCTRCHGEQWWQQSPVFELAGTVYRKPGDGRGVRGASVVVLDAEGHEIEARTNAGGNFFFTQGGSETTRFDDGRVQIPFELAFPLRVRVRIGDDEQVMRGAIWRERSCAACHRGEPGEESNGPIFVVEGAP